MLLNAQNLWDHFIDGANYLLKKEEPFYSPKDKSPYLVIDVSPNDGVRLVRVESSGTTETIGKGRFETCINNINTFGHQIPKGGIYKIVLIETAIVEILNFLDWSFDKKQIEVDIMPVPLVDQNQIEAKGERRMVSIAVRNGQQKLKLKLMNHYQGQCAVSGCGIEEVLNACHITPFAESFICLAEDAILLRADLHHLFDKKLLAIHPETFKIHISSKIRNSEYGVWHEKDIRPPTGEGKINPAGLIQRWEQFEDQ